MTRQVRSALFARCALLLALSLFLRVLPALELTAVRLPDFGHLTRLLSAADEPAPPSSAEEEQPLREIPELRFRDVPPETDSEPEPALPMPTFTAEDTARLNIRGNCTLSYDAAALLTAALPAAPDADGPQILIVHTHSTEAYEPEPGWEYEETEPYRTLDPEHSVIRLGCEIAAVLEQHGIPVLHDKTINDYPSYAGSYDRMAAIIEDHLVQYPSIRMVLDVHRDAFENPDGSMGGTAENGTAKIMLVTGTDEGGLYHPHWQQNLSCAMKLDLLLQEMPGLSRGISLVTQRYNQHLTPFSLLAEFGAAGDTLQEAMAAANAFARSLARLLSG